MAHAAGKSARGTWARPTPPAYAGAGTGPNQLWDGDVTWLTTAERSAFLYLDSLLDHFSRKVVAWLIGEAFTSDQVQALWDQGLINEGVLERPAHQWPAFLSDRGAQMRSHSTQRYFDTVNTVGIRQLLSRPRTPNDNPRIEAHFGTVKTHPVYPGFFADPPAAVTYFTSFYDWYNTTHVLTTLNLLTPQQVHTGQAATLLATRAAHAARAQTARRTACHHPFTLEALIADPRVRGGSRYPVYSWAGPQPGSAKQATPIA